MEPIFTIKLVQDTNTWQQVLQALTAISVIIAAFDAAYFANKKNRDEQKTKKRYLKRLLTDLESNCSVFTSHIIDWKSEATRNASKIIDEHISALIGEFKGNRSFFASACPDEVLGSIAKIPLLYDIVKGILDRVTENSQESLLKETQGRFEYLINEVKKAKKLQEIYCKPFPFGNIDLARYRIKAKKEIKKAK